MKANRVVFFLLLSFSIFFSRLNLAQNSFIAHYGGSNYEWGYSVIQTADGGYAMAGVSNTPSSGGNYDVYVVKINSAGAVQWSNTIGGNQEEYAYDIKELAASQGYIITGTTRSYGAGGRDVYLVKLNSSGTLAWTRVYGHMGDDVAYGTIELPNGSFISAGWTSSTAPWRQLIIWINSSGAVTADMTRGGTNDYGALSVSKTSNNELITCGWTWYNTITNGLYITRMTTNGTIIFQATVDGNLEEWGRSIRQTADGGYIVAGTSYVSGETLIAKVNSNGSSVQWSNKYPFVMDEGGQYIIQTTDGGFAVTGRTQLGSGSWDVALIKLTSNGNVQWFKTYGSPSHEEGRSIIQTSDGGYLIAGGTWGYGPGGSMFLVKTDSDGNAPCAVTTQTLSVTSYGLLSAASTSWSSPSYGSTSGGSATDQTWSGTNSCTGGLMPVELLYFVGECKDNSVQLNWGTASEENNSHFEVERAMAAGSNLQWETIGRVQGAGNSSTFRNYEFIDTELPAAHYLLPTVYYRLKQVDYDGKYEYFGPISVKCREPDEWELILQNTPATDELLGTLFSPKDKTVQMEIADLHGRKIHYHLQSISKGSNMIKIDLKTIQSGVYFINVKGNGKQIVRKFVKVN